MLRRRYSAPISLLTHANSQLPHNYPAFIPGRAIPLWGGLSDSGARRASSGSGSGGLLGMSGLGDEGGARNDGGGNGICKVVLSSTSCFGARLEGALCGMLLSAIRAALGAFTLSSQYPPVPRSRRAHDAAHGAQLPRPSAAAAEARLP